MQDDVKTWLAESLDSTASWRRDVAERFPDDRRNQRCATAIGLAAEYVRGLPADHEGLGKLARIPDVLELDVWLAMSSFGASASQFFFDNGWGEPTDVHFEGLIGNIYRENLEGLAEIFDPMHDWNPDNARLPAILDFLQEESVRPGAHPFAHTLGHYPGHLREPFDSLEPGDSSAKTIIVEVDYEPEEWQVERYLDLMRGCTDTMPGSVCGDLGIPRGTSYGEAAKFLRRARALYADGVPEQEAWDLALDEFGLLEEAA